MKHKLMTMVATTCLSLTGVFSQNAGAFQAPNCQPFYGQQGPRLCMTGVRGPRQLKDAQLDCTDIKGRVSTFEDWYYRRFRGDGALVPTGVAPFGHWLGHRTADNIALFANGQFLPIGGDFDGETSVFQFRRYTCSHEDHQP